MIAAGLLLLERFFDRDDFRALLGCAVALGIATLIKGPMAPVIAIVLFLLEWRRRRRAPRGNYLPAIAALVLIPLAWFVPAMVLGGHAYAREVIVKQTVGRAVATWVHQAPPWFYVLHLPATLFPWFFLAVVAVIARPRSFLVNWIVAVILPYSLMASKLDVYMMAMIPAVALLIAGYDGRWIRAANAIAAGLLILALAGLFLKRPELTALLVFTAVVGAIALIVILRSSPAAGTIAAGIAALLPLLYVAVVMMPFVNEQASTRPLAAALVRQRVPAEEIALYWCPYLWTRDMPRELERVVYADSVQNIHPRVIATSRAHANEIAPFLAQYHRVDQVQMIGKWFDVYRR